MTSAFRFPSTGIFVILSFSVGGSGPALSNPSAPIRSNVNDTCSQDPNKCAVVDIVNDDEYPADVDNICADHIHVDGKHADGKIYKSDGIFNIELSDIINDCIYPKPDVSGLDRHRIDLDNGDYAIHSTIDCPEFKDRSLQTRFILDMANARMQQPAPRPTALMMCPCPRLDIVLEGHSRRPNHPIDGRRNHDGQLADREKDFQGEARPRAVGNGDDHLGRYRRGRPRQFRCSPCAFPFHPSER